MFELVKNSLRAVNDRYADRDDLPPPIRLVVAEGGEDVTIKVLLCRMWEDYLHRWPAVVCSSM